MSICFRKSKQNHILGEYICSTHKQRIKIQTLYKELLQINKKGKKLNYSDKKRLTY